MTGQGPLESPTNVPGCILFLVTRNRGLSGTELVDRFVELLRASLPGSWRVSLDRDLKPAADEPGVDARLRVQGPEGQAETLLIQTKTSLEPRDVPLVVLPLRRDSRRAVVVAPYLSPRTRERLLEWHVGYADGTGNLRLALDRPALFVERVGASSNPWPENRPLRSLKGPAAARVVRTLCDYWPPVGIRELSKRSRASVGSVVRVIDLLDREDLIEREPRGEVVDVRWQELIRHWARDYSFVDSNRVQSFLDPRGLRSLLGRLRAADWRYVVTGSLAAAQVAPLTAPRLAAVYTEGALGVARNLDLRPAESGGNVLLAEPLDPVVFDRSWQRDGVGYAALSQAAADLLTSPARGPAEADELMSWMEQNPDAWRIRAGL